MSKIIKKKSEKFLKKYLDNPAPVGYEAESQKIWMSYLTPYVDEFITDAYGTAVGIINPESNFRVVIEAHSDEISWVVKYIRPDGLIHVARNGGTDQQIAPSKRVKIHTKNGLIDGVFGHPAVHVRRGKDTPVTVDSITVDVGCETKEEVEALGIHVGCVITYPDGLMVLNKNKYVCRALDNRIGGFMIAEVARLLKENNIDLNFSLYVTNSVQEEIGLRGAQMISKTIQPDVAIVTDVCHDTNTPGINKAIEGDTKCGGGPVISYAPAVHNNLREIIIKTAEDKSIDFQRLASSTSTGTDTDAFAYGNGGTPSALISLPLRYMHTTVETVHKDDVEGCIKLIYETLLKLNKMDMNQIKNLSYI